MVPTMRKFRLSAISCVPVIMISALGSISTANPGDPPRPLIVNNTLYSGLDGHKLRGDHKEVVWDTRALTPSTWDEKKDILFNFRRVDGNKPPDDPDTRPNTDPVLWQSIDSCVNMAARSGQYMELLYGGVYGGGGTHQVEFWRLAAPRYKNRTHIIYELKNEPDLSWIESSASDGCPAIAKMVRDSAPNTMIFPFGQECGANKEAFNAFKAFDSAYLAEYKVKWDYGNSAVAFHGYDGDMSYIDSISALHPCMEDEAQVWNFDDLLQCEQKRIAWCYFDGKQAWDDQLLVDDATTRGYAWWINPVLVLSAGSVSITGSIGAANPPGVDVRTVNDGGGTLVSATVSIAYQQGNNWLTVQKSGTGNLQMLTNSVSTSGMSQGVYHATVTVTTSNSTSPTASYAVVFTVSGVTAAQNRTTVTAQSIRMLSHALIAGGPFETRVRITDAKGRTVRAETFAGVGHVDFSDLKPGVYQASVSTSRGTQSVKFTR